MPKRPRKATPRTTPVSTAQSPPLPERYRVDVVVIRAELTSIGTDGRADGRVPTSEVPVFAKDFGMTVTEILERAGLKREFI